MENKALFNKIDEYFKDIVSKTDNIKGYISISQEELQKKLTQKIENPIMVFSGYEGKLDGNNQRTIGNRTIQFVILFKCHPNNTQEQINAINAAENIGLNIISRIKYDATKSSNWLYKSFDQSSVHFNEFYFQNAVGLFGCQFSFELENKNSLSIDKSFWLDDIGCES